MAPGPIPLQSDWVYGPVQSRRLGRSLGVNPLPTTRKLCNMDCVYCQYATEPGEVQYPAVQEVLAAVERALNNKVQCDRITLAGNGEPTLHPKLGEIVSGLVALRDRLVPQAELSLLSNATRLGRPDVRRALESIDLPILKLDAGDEATFQAINVAPGCTLRQVVGWLSEQPRLVLQALFCEGRVSNSSPDQVAAWLAVVRNLRPEAVQVTTVDRGTREHGILPVSSERLQAIAGQVREAGSSAEVFGCRDPSRFLESS